MKSYTDQAAALWLMLGVTPEMCRAARNTTEPNRQLFADVWTSLPPGAAQDIRLQASRARTQLLRMKGSFASLEAELAAQCPAVHALVPCNPDDVAAITESSAPTTDEFRGAIAQRMTGDVPWFARDRTCVSWYRGLSDGVRKDAGNASGWFGRIAQAVRPKAS